MYLLKYSILLILAILYLPRPAFADDSEVVIPLNFWSSQRVLSKAVGTILEEHGMAVEYKEISASDQWGAMQRGVVHFQVEVWQSSMEGIFNSMLEKGHVVDLGNHQSTTREEWWYPLYVEEQCPGLPDWQALKSCAAIFTNGSHKGIYINGPWEYDDANLIRALDLEFTLVRVASEAELWRALNQAQQHKKPILMLNWTPNWTDKYIPGRFVEFPAYHPQCDIEPRWGISPDFVRDCGNPKQGWLKKVAWPGLQGHHPCVVALLKAMDFSTEMIAEASSMVAVEGQDQHVAAKHWLDKFAEEVLPWKAALAQCLAEQSSSER
ncbi:ABC transporter substrate-binding protein [Aliiglaciecola sp. CAU 1673]|uniref:ABC transporter substrate-binding protein n=1 Tax=Aliiglaciecola sp. CAU 1673 TaxID=3032595 RepID=UPI0023DC1878|nr:ABC transporter substrate-binding protein [Aliiglaciecola sp. CAU 1673]MDF2178968.1 ABC transporter substrate-binding protein [Aliiglaciecola sp. CAU 1673]